MTDYLTRNLKSFSTRFSGLDHLATQSLSGIEIQNTASGLPTARCEGYLLHSAYDPVREARTFASQTPEGSRLCLYGFGLGYHVEALLEKIGTEGALLVVELNPALLAAAFHARDLAALAADPRLTLIHADHEAEAAERMAEGMAWLDPSGTGVPAVLFHTASFQCLPEGFERIANALEVLQMERRVPALFGNLEIMNFAMNRETVQSSPGINSLRNRFFQKPGLLVSAGPSLDGLLPFLPDLHRRCVTGCVDTALPALRTLGITPDFIFTLDPQEESFAHFEENLECSSPLVFTPTANARVIRHYRGEKIVVFKEQHSATRDQESLEQEKGTTRAGGSVSCLGLDCLIQMGCNPIVLVGQDCAFPGLRGYARSTSAEDPGGRMLSSFHTTAAGQKAHACRLKPVMVESCDGREVLTNSILFSYLRTLEQIAYTHPEIRVVNLASHGARIQPTQTLGSVNEVMTIL